jgi:hypothetical protein
MIAPDALLQITGVVAVTVSPLTQRNAPPLGSGILSRTS